MKFKSLALFICLCFQASNVFSEGGSGVGNGGDALLIRNKPILLDLVEAGVEKNPYVNHQWDNSIDMFHMYGKVKSAVNLYQYSNRQDDIPEMIILAAKFLEIETSNPLLARVLLESIQLYDFRLVNSELVNINDEQSSIDYNPNKLVQLACRRGYTIMINQKLWKKLDSINKAALILHEVIYALGSKVLINGEPAQYSPHARAIVGYLFSNKPIYLIEKLLVGNELAKLSLSPYNQHRGDARKTNFFKKFSTNNGIQLYVNKLHVESIDNYPNGNSTDARYNLDQNYQWKELEKICGYNGTDQKTVRLTIRETISLERNPEINGVSISFPTEFFIIGVSFNASTNPNLNTSCTSMILYGLTTYILYGNDYP